MSGNVYDILDELAARGRRLRGQLPGDYKPIDGADPMAGLPVYAYSLILPGTPASDEEQWSAEVAA